MRKYLICIIIFLAASFGASNHLCAQKITKFVLGNKDDHSLELYNITGSPEGCAAVIMKQVGVQSKYSFGVRGFDEDLNMLSDADFPGTLPTYLRVTSFGKYSVVVGFNKEMVEKRPAALPVVFKIMAYSFGNELAVDETFKAQNIKSEFDDKAFVSVSKNGENLIVCIEEKVNWNASGDHKFLGHLRVYDKNMNCVFTDALKFEEIGKEGTRLSNMAFDYSDGKLYVILYKAAPPLSKAKEGLAVVVYDQPGHLLNKQYTSLVTTALLSESIIAPDGDLIMCSLVAAAPGPMGASGEKKIQFAKICPSGQRETVLTSMTFGKEYFKAHPEYAKFDKHIEKPAQLVLCGDGVVYVTECREYGDYITGKNLSFIKIGYDGELKWFKMILRDDAVSENDKFVKVFPLEDKMLVLYAPIGVHSGAALVSKEGEISKLNIENTILNKEYKEYNSFSGIIRLDDGRFVISGSVSYAKETYFSLRLLDVSGM